MNQRHETPSDKSESNINPKTGGGFKGKKQKGVRFWARRTCSIGPPKHITTHINSRPKDKYVSVRNKDESKTDSNFSCQIPPNQYIKKEIQCQKKS